MEAIIRQGKEEDLSEVLELIKELAVFERAPDAVSNTLQRMKEDGFGPNPIYGFFVAEKSGAIIGLSLYYYRYSTWKGKCLYLEDLIVTESERKNGAGTDLFDATVQFAKDNDCIRMNWQVLDWNQSAIDFYKKYGADLDGEWINGTLDTTK
jgi:GNAT superfamily N-acetyltransferase